MSKSKELQLQRQQLQDALNALRAKRERAFRANSDALARERAGVTKSDATTMAGLADAEVGGDAEMTRLRREIERIDAELDRSGGFMRRISRRERN